MANIALLEPVVQDLCNRLIHECKVQLGLEIAIVQTYRTIKEQDELYAQGRTKPGERVTKARGGFSLHNFRVAFDACPKVGGKLDWKTISNFEKIGIIGESLGLEWGGRWKSIKDRPHFQYLAGYRDKDFFAGNIVDWKKFEGTAPHFDAPHVVTILPVHTLKVNTSALNVRKGPGIEFPVLGKLFFGKAILPLETTGDWVKIHFEDDFGYVSGKFLTSD